MMSRHAAKDRTDMNYPDLGLLEAWGTAGTAEPLQRPARRKKGATA
jgi:hypothetical protein